MNKKQLTEDDLSYGRYVHLMEEGRIRILPTEEEVRREFKNEVMQLPYKSATTVMPVLPLMVEYVGELGYKDADLKTRYGLRSETLHAIRNGTFSGRNEEKYRTALVMAINDYKLKYSRSMDEEICEKRRKAVAMLANIALVQNGIAIDSSV